MTKLALLSLEKYADNETRGEEIVEKQLTPQLIQQLTAQLIPHLTPQLAPPLKSQTVINLEREARAQTLSALFQQKQDKSMSNL